MTREEKIKRMVQQMIDSGVTTDREQARATVLQELRKPGGEEWLDKSIKRGGIVVTDVEKDDEGYKEPKKQGQDRHPEIDIPVHPGPDAAKDWGDLGKDFVKAAGIAFPGGEDKPEEIEMDDFKKETPGLVNALKKTEEERLDSLLSMFEGDDEGKSAEDIWEEKDVENFISRYYEDAYREEMDDDYLKPSNPEEAEEQRRRAETYNRLREGQADYLAGPEQEFNNPDPRLATGQINQGNIALDAQGGMGVNPLVPQGESVSPYGISQQQLMQALQRSQMQQDQPGMDMSAAARNEQLRLQMGMAQGGRIDPFSGRRRDPFSRIGGSRGSWGPEDWNPYGGNPYGG
jgi:hypothetical protein